MSWSDVVSQVQAIEARFQELGFTRPATTAVSSTGATSFASALDGASGTTAATATASTSGALVSNGTTGDDVVAAAKGYLGTPYVLGGESKSGIDCSGLVQAVFKQLGVSVPRLVHEQQTVGQAVPSLKDAKPGDLVVLNGGDHIAIWAGNGMVVHAPYAGRTVSLQKAWFTDADVTTIRRVVPSTGDAGATAGTSTALSAATTATGSTSTGLSSAATARATAMLSQLAAMDGSTDSSAGSSTSLSSLLSSFGVTGTAGSTSAQQLIAAQSALLGTSD